MKYGVLPQGFTKATACKCMNRKAPLDLSTRAFLVVILLSGFFNLLSLNSGLDLEGKNIKLLGFISTLILRNFFQAFKHKS